MTPKELKQIKARCEAASEGPWEICKEDGVDIIGNNGEIILELSGKMLGCTVRPYNFKFIAHARTDIPALIAEVERLKKREDDFADLLASANNDVKQLNEYINNLRGT